MATPSTFAANVKYVHFLTLLGIRRERASGQSRKGRKANRNASGGDVGAVCRWDYAFISDPALAPVAMPAQMGHQVRQGFRL